MKVTSRPDPVLQGTSRPCEVRMRWPLKVTSQPDPVLQVTSRPCEVNVRRVQIPVNPCRVNVKNINVNNVSSSSRVVKEKFPGRRDTPLRRGQQKGGTMDWDTPLRRERQKGGTMDWDTPLRRERQKGGTVDWDTPLRRGRQMGGTVNYRRMKYEDDIFANFITLKKATTPLLLEHSSSTDSSMNTTPEHRQEDIVTGYLLNMSQSLRGPHSPRSPRLKSPFLWQSSPLPRSYIQQRVRKRLDLGPSISDQEEGVSEKVVDKDCGEVRVGTELRELLKTFGPALVDDKLDSDQSFNASPHG